MENPQIAAPVTVLLGLIAPLVISTLKAAGAPKWANQLLALVISFAAGILTVGLARGFGDLSAPAIIGYSAAVFAIAEVAYRRYFRETTLNARLAGWLWGPPEPEPTGGS